MNQTEQSTADKIKALKKPIGYAYDPCLYSITKNINATIDKVLAILEADKPVDAGKFAEFTSYEGFTCINGIWYTRKTSKSYTTNEFIELFKTKDNG